MSAGSPKFTVSRIAALSLVSLWLAGCTSSSNPPAPVTSVDGGSSSNTNSGMLITPPPKMGATTQQAPQIQPVQRPVTQPLQTQPVAEQPVQMENGRIVYNRQYGNIPKGSYAGGSTYTVKKGDTLFYIAWITGNDFRDLAQRNSIPAPYSLNVGQTLQVGNAAGTPITGGNAITQADAAQQGVVTRPAQNSTVAVASQPTITYSEAQVNKVLTKCAKQQACWDGCHSACNGTNGKHDRTKCKQYVNQRANFRMALADGWQSDRKLWRFRRGQ